MRLAWRIRRHRLALLCLSALAGLTPYLAASADEMPSATRLDTARAMLATADVPATAPLALLSVDCPMGIGQPRPACRDSYLLSLLANSHIGQPGTDRTAWLPAEWSGPFWRSDPSRRNAQWLAWLGETGASAPFDAYRLQAVAFALETRDPHEALALLAPMWQRRGDLPRDTQRALRYWRFSALLSAGDDASASALLRDIQRQDGTVERGTLTYAATVWLTRAPSRLAPWRNDLPADWQALLAWRLDGAAITDRMLAPVESCCGRTAFVTIGQRWDSVMSLRLYAAEHAMAWPLASYVAVNSASLLLMRKPWPTISATRWWQIQDRAWQTARAAVPALPNDLPTLTRLAAHPDDLYRLPDTEQSVNLNSATARNVARILIQVQVGQRAADPAARIKALLDANVFGGNATGLYRLFEQDPTLVGGLSAMPQLASLLLSEAARQYRWGGPGSDRDRALGKQIADTIPMLSIDAPEQRNTYPHTEIEREHWRIAALLQLDAPGAASRYALHDLRQIRARPDLNSGWQATAVQHILDVIQYRQRFGQADAARTLACQALPIADGMSELAPRMRQALARQAIDCAR